MSDLTPFDAIAGNLALDFVNTVAYRGDPAKCRDKLAGLSDLQRWLATFGLPASDLEEGDLEAARAIRERLHDLFQPSAHGRSVDPTALLGFERDLQQAMRERKLQLQDEHVVWGWSADAGALHRSLFAVLEKAAELLVSNDLRQVRECQGPGCGWLFVDRSRGRPRRWCSMRDCGNKAKARRHYHRRAGT
jgi:predicted RNA-binding Zn ribbon-like protein